MSIYLSAQQNRLNQSVARGDLLRTQLDAANGEVQDYSQKVSQLEREMPRILSERPDVREEVESQLRSWKAELARSTQRQTDLVGRLADVDASIQTDLNGWREMIARLEQLTRP